MNFEYNKQTICTTDLLKLSVADLRDLIGAQAIENKEQMLLEVQTILQCILRKNGLPIGTLNVQ
jgi:hypothetical protein